MGVTMWTAFTRFKTGISGGLLWMWYNEPLDFIKGGEFIA
jgi:hypothetical protein